jgi:parallel beta-helix repeat protein
MTKLKLHIIFALALCGFAFCGMAAAEQLYVNEGGWWRDGGAFNASGTPIQAAVDNAGEGDTIFVWNGTYYEGGGVSISKERITLQGEDANTTTIHGKWTADNVVYVSGNYVNVSGFTVTGSASSESGIYAYADNCAISGNSIYDCGEGIYLSGSDNNISHNNVSECIYGIFLRYSSNNTLENNTVNSNDYSGIYIVYSNNNMFSNNTVNSNDFNGGVHLWFSSNNTLRSNTVNSNSYGFCLHPSSNNNLITGNSIEANVHGIRLVESTSMDNIIIENTIANNTQYGIYLDYSGDNEIYHNNFINNNKQAYDHHGFNEWDKGSIIGGNYWSDHVCYGNPSDGTEPYTGIDTDAGAVDNYPFEEPNGWATPPPPVTTADATIALQIAVGSREYDPLYDVSGDGRVTSLDALMILQTAAGAMDLS